MKIFNPQHHQAKKRFGQNFLVDQSMIDQIIRNINPKTTDNLIEIGPGLGALTREVLQQAEKISVIELDKEVIPKLKFNCDGLGELMIYQQDALKTDFSQFANKQPIRVIGNLPYNISTPILFHLFSFLSHIKDMHFMLQKEVVERMVASPNNKTYGRLSVMTQYFCEPLMLFLVPPESFQPAPKVESAIVRLLPKQQANQQVKDFQLFSNLVSQAFNQRRKTIRNSWKNIVSQQQFEEANIASTLRPENLSLNDFISIADIISTQTK